MMKLYFVRHGSTGANEGGKRQSPQTPLSMEGKGQAQKAGEWLADKKIEMVLSSPWVRARQTAEIVAKKLDKRIEFLEILHEKAHNPKLYGASMESEIHKQYAREYVKNKENYDWKLRGKGESIREMLERGIELKGVLGGKYAGKTLAVVSHAYFLGGFVSLCLKGENFETKEFKERFRTIGVDNGGISLVESDRDGRSWRVPFFNLKPES